jgi:hypothetical protein
MGPKRRGPSPSPYRHAGGRTCRDAAVLILVLFVLGMAAAGAGIWQVIAS